MTAAAASPSQGKAILLMIGAVLCFTVMDAAAKGLAPRIGLLPTLWARYTGQMLLVLLLVLPRLQSVVRTHYPALQLLRSIFLLCATAFFFAGLSRIPISEASALMSVNPVLVTLGAALFLGEALGPRRIAGIAAALCGAMIIIRPGSDVFSPDALFPLAAAVCYSGYALLTRRVGSGEDPWTSLFYTALVGTILLSAAVLRDWTPIDPWSWGMIGVIAVFGTMGQLALIRALSLGEAAMLAPYSYTGLVFATVWGVLLFDEWPDLWTLCGALVIAGAGLYVWHRETRRR